MAVAKYLAFSAFIIFAGTGIAVGYTGASLLVGYVSYLSPWLPAWLWLVVGSMLFLGVAITAVSTAGSIATLSPNPKAFKVCLSLLLLMVASEISSTLFAYNKQDMLAQSLSSYLDNAMLVSAHGYGENATDTQMWDEIQLELNCCGIQEYKDWYQTPYGNQSSVPDSCCLQIVEGCGKDIVNNVAPEDEIVTQGCLPVMSNVIAMDYQKLGRGVWLPVCAMHIALLVLLAAASMFLHESFTQTNLKVYAGASSGNSRVLTSSPKYQHLEEHC